MLSTFRTGRPARGAGVFVPIALLVFLGGLATAQPDGAPPAPAGLRCEYLEDPIGIDVPQPRFQWVLAHPDRGQEQTAYQVLVSTAPDAAAGDQWDSGRVQSGEPAQIAYAGKPLSSGRTYYWKVRFWDSRGKASAYSRKARFETGLLSGSDWKGKWIGGANQLRKEFALGGHPVRARAYIVGLGYYELRINGRKVGDHVLDPGWTTYDRRVLYVTYDVTSYLRSGPNVVGILLGQGWYGSRAALLQLSIEFEGGRSIEVVSDGSWKSAAGPLVSDSVFDGEVYDARLETPGWDRPGVDDSAWKAAATAPAPKGALSAQMMPPIRVVDTIVPLRMTSPRPDVHVYDMGQNFSGWVRLRVKGPRGTRVKLRHAELLYEDGALNTENLRRASATDVYILRGDGEEEVYEPRFTYHGFRYVELTGFPGAPRLDTVRGRVVHTAVRPAGGFTSSKAILDRLQSNVLWGFKTNLHSVPTDCNQRDERMGWMADAHLAAETGILNFDMAAFYTNFLRNIRDAQGADGTLADTVPQKWGRRPADPAWGGAYPHLVWYLYQYYGDRRILEQHYAGVKAWADYLRSRSEHGVLNYSHYGDWVAVEKIPGPLVSTFFYYFAVDVVARTAAVLGNETEASAYRKLAAEIQAAFHNKFFNRATNSHGSGAQAAQVLALFLDLAPQELRGSVFRTLVNDIVYAKNTHLTTGIIGTKYLFPVLTRMGQSSLAYELATQTSYPSWGHMIENGATTIWELWQNKTGPAMNSHNHPAFGSIGAWFYQALAGINLVQDAPGFRRIRIEPHVVRDLGWASATVETIRGTVSSSWRRTAGGLRLEVTVPVGSEAEVHVPKFGQTSVVIKEGDQVVWKNKTFYPGSPGISAARDTDTAVVFQTGSGGYMFELIDL